MEWEGYIESWMKCVYLSIKPLRWVTANICSLTWNNDPHKGGICKLAVHHIMSEKSTDKCQDAPPLLNFSGTVISWMVWWFDEHLSAKPCSRDKLSSQTSGLRGEIGTHIKANQ